jgi:hypothetical protein
VKSKVNYMSCNPVTEFDHWVYLTVNWLPELPESFATLRCLHDAPRKPASIVGRTYWAHFQETECECSIWCIWGDFQENSSVRLVDSLVPNMSTRRAQCSPTRMVRRAQWMSCHWMFLPLPKSWYNRPPHSCHCQRTWLNSRKMPHGLRNSGLFYVIMVSWSLFHCNLSMLVGLVCTVFFFSRVVYELVFFCHLSTIVILLFLFSHYSTYPQ